MVELKLKKTYHQSKHIFYFILLLLYYILFLLLFFLPNKCIYPEEIGC